MSVKSTVCYKKLLLMNSFFEKFNFFIQTYFCGESTSFLKIIITE